MSSANMIVSLVYSYAEHIDKGDLPAAAKLFTHACVKISRDGTTIDSEGLLALLRRLLILYPDGTPRTKHLVTNPIIEMDEAAGEATCRSCYSVLHAAPDDTLKIVAAGRYHDRFQRVDGQWRFAFRDYSLLDMVGDISTHVSEPLHRNP